MATNNTVENPIPGDSLKEKQEYILKNYTLLKLGIFDPPKQNLESFVEKFLLKYNIKYGTCYVNNGAPQCRQGARRSLIDLYLLCKHYYPKCGIWRVKRALFKVMDKLEADPDSMYGISSCICSVIRRRVYYKSGKAQELRSQGDRDEFGWTIQDMRDAPPPKTEAVKEVKEVKKPRISKVAKERAAHTMKLKS